MLTVEIHHMMVQAAGPKFTWDVVEGMAGWRYSPDPRAGLRYFLGEYAGWRCAACGRDLDISEAEVCHIVSRGKAKKGFLFGNVFYGCTDCNTAQKENGPIVEFHELIPELIPGPEDNPGTPFLRDIGKEIR